MNRGERVKVNGCCEGPSASTATDVTNEDPFYYHNREIFGGKVF